MSSKLLTGENIWQAFVNHRLAYRAWNDVTPQTQSIYDDIAKVLNEDLGLLEEPLQPQAPNTVVHEKGLYFLLIFPGPEGPETIQVRTLPELCASMTKHLNYPADSFGYSYFIEIWRIEPIALNQRIGRGQYQRTQQETKILDETGAAKGLNDELYIYHFNHC